MDLGYILFNTLVYGLIAFVFSCFFSYGKFLNLSLGAVVIFVGYCMQALVVGGFSWSVVGWFLAIVMLYRGVNHIALRQFTNEKQRDLFGLIFTLGVSILIENSINYIFGPSSVSVSGFSLSLTMLIIVFIGVSGLVLYILRYTYAGVILQGIQERSKVIRSLGIPSNRRVMVVFGVLFVVMIGVAGLILVDGNMRASDSLFYVIKALGIMIMVGVAHKQYILLGSLLYVLLEYGMFITRGLPIAYKETLILAIILLVLLVKPEGLFSYRKRIT